MILAPFNLIYKFFKVHLRLFHFFSFTIRAKIQIDNTEFICYNICRTSAFLYG